MTVPMEGDNDLAPDTVQSETVASGYRPSVEEEARVESDAPVAETRRSTSTSEFYVFLVLSVALVFFAYESGRDSFARDEAWRYVSWLGVGYLISRGLAKAGVRGR